jgi:hypothetical protein
MEFDIFNTKDTKDAKDTRDMFIFLFSFVILSALCVESFDDRE